MQKDSTGSGAFDATRTDVTVIAADFSRTETVTDLNAGYGRRASAAVVDVIDHDAYGRKRSISDRNAGEG